MNVERVEYGSPQYIRFREVRQRLLGLDAQAASALEFGPIKKRLTHFIAMEGGHCAGIADLYTPQSPTNTGQARVSAFRLGGGAVEALSIAVRREAQARGLAGVDVVIAVGCGSEPVPGAYDMSATY